uniref:Nudix hydrolase domain-containing protein n=1 Tax=Aplanochytrium stocchinoi TaxID=215587 RepID=A0A7S3V2Q0_9STRA|mmetsp:Transcript_26706/g.32380  ORF Transcript_26706/g.32380 Transcript_26706/m.32380 type:complete len:312 (-) Transcript_26706:520-1455(-)
MVELLKARINSYNSVEVTDPCTLSLPQTGDFKRVAPISVRGFEERLWFSLHKWKKEGRKGVFIEISREHCELIPVAIRAGFEFHHAEGDYVMLCAWLQDPHENKLPPGPVHFIGVGGFVVRPRAGVINPDRKNHSDYELLVIKELSGPSANLSNFWKLPGGLADQHEDIKDAVMREIKEECGIDTEFGRLCVIQEAHHTSAASGASRKGATDMYCICALTPKDPDQEIVIQETELAAARWMPLDEYLSLPFYSRENTAYFKMMQAAADVALGNAPGLEVGSYDLGFGRGVKHTLLSAAGAENRLELVTAKL